jgi:hypothetical protein
MVYQIVPAHERQRSSKAAPTQTTAAGGAAAPWSASGVRRHSCVLKAESIVVRSCAQHSHMSHQRAAAAMLDLVDAKQCRSRRRDLEPRQA